MVNTYKHFEITLHDLRFVINKLRLLAHMTGIFLWLLVRSVLIYDADDRIVESVITC